MVESNRKMVLLEKREVKASRYFDVLLHNFQQDRELISRWHICSGSTPKECAADSTEVLHNNTDKSTFALYEVLLGKESIGFFGSEMWNGGHFMTTFFLLPAYRKRMYVSSFWRLLSRHFKYKEFHTAIYEKNTRALDHLLKMGGVIEQKFPDGKGTAVIIRIKI